MRAIQAGKLPDCAHSSAAHRLLRSTLIGLTAMVLAASAAEIRTVVVTNDLVIAKDKTLNVRLIVCASQVTIDGQGSTLHGPGAADNLASLEQAGVGLLVEGCVNVTIRNLRVRGFATGLVVRDSQALLIEDCDFSDNYHNPKHGWGELPPPGRALARAHPPECLASQQSQPRLGWPPPS